MTIFTSFIKRNFPYIIKITMYYTSVRRFFFSFISGFAFSLRPNLKNLKEEKQAHLYHNMFIGYFLRGILIKMKTRTRRTKTNVLCRYILFRACGYQAGNFASIRMHHLTPALPHLIPCLLVRKIKGTISKKRKKN